jgi:hypothetical protein
MAKEKGGLVRMGDTCGGGKLLLPPQSTVFLDGFLVVVVGTMVAPHDSCEGYENVYEKDTSKYSNVALYLGNDEEHCAAWMIEGQKDVLAEMIPICREGEDR